MYRGDGIYFQEVINDDSFVLGCKNIMMDLSIHEGDKIGLFWDTRFACFQFRLMRTFKMSSV